MSFMEALTNRIRSIIEAVTTEQRARLRYNESMFTELLTELAGKKLLSNADCKAIIARAKARAKAKEDADCSKKPKCPCMNCDTRPHRPMACERCGVDTLHLIEGDTARCRFCLTAQAVPTG